LVRRPGGWDRPGSSAASAAPVAAPVAAPLSSPGNGAVPGFRLRWDGRVFGWEVGAREDGGVRDGGER
jgi:hypothetical protein